MVLTHSPPEYPVRQSVESDGAADDVFVFACCCLLQFRAGAMVGGPQTYQLGEPHGSHLSASRAGTKECASRSRHMAMCQSKLSRLAVLLHSQERWPPSAVDPNSPRVFCVIHRPQNSPHQCDEEAVRVIGASPKWKAGKQRGRPVKVRMILPITFKLG